jgi:uncharacterized protein YjbI with pentapeptide repeats
MMTGMADPEHVDRIRSGVRHWNSWRRTHPSIKPDLSQLRLTSGSRLIGADLAAINLIGASLRATTLARANLTCANLSGADLSGANLAGAKLQRAKLTGANLGGADFFQADLSSTDLRRSDLSDVDLFRSFLRQSNLSGSRIRKAREAVLIQAKMRDCDLAGAQLQGADLTDCQMPGVNLRGANLVGSVLVGANLTKADLRESELIGANLSRANLERANLRDANLASAILNETTLTRADLTGCHVYGMSAWDLKLDGAKQEALSITPERDAVIVVDNLEVAQFIYLLLNNARIKRVIDSITSKAVLILGRFTPERKQTLDRIRTHLRTRDVLPIIFDFGKPRARSILETVSTLAHMSRVVLADLTDAKYVKREIPLILRALRVPVHPFIVANQVEPEVITRLRTRYRRLQPTIQYKSTAGLLRKLDQILA